MPFNKHPRPDVLASLSDIKPVPFWLDDPSRPEPVSALTRIISTPIINLTRWSMDQSDRNAGKRNLWLKTLDALGLGFDS